MSQSLGLTANLEHEVRPVDASLFSYAERPEGTLALRIRTVKR